jgi:hypothetical protein
MNSKHDDYGLEQCQEEEYEGSGKEECLLAFLTGHAMTEAITDCDWGGEGGGQSSPVMELFFRSN